MMPAAGVVFALDGVFLGAGDVRYLRNLTLVSPSADSCPASGSHTCSTAACAACGSRCACSSRCAWPACCGASPATNGPWSASSVDILRTVDPRLTTAQMEAIAFVRAAAGPSTDPCDAVVTINFHPDRIDAGGRGVIEGLLADGRFRSQFETGISNGGLTAHPGGDRDRWEERDVRRRLPAARGRARRPAKYGALDLRRNPAGAACRFGSAHLRLRPEVNARTTFTLKDSYLEPVEAGRVRRDVVGTGRPARPSRHRRAARRLRRGAGARPGRPRRRRRAPLVLDGSFAGRLPAAEALAARLASGSNGGPPRAWHRTRCPASSAGPGCAPSRRCCASATPDPSSTPS